MEENSNQPDWSISELYEKSWEIIKKNKVLWVFGMALAGAGSSFSSFSNSSSNFKDLINPSSSPLASPASNQISQVLGAAASNPNLPDIGQIILILPWYLYLILGNMAPILASIPWYLYLILGLEILALVILGYTISIIYSVWSHASLIQGVQKALGSEKLTIADTSEKAFPAIKSLAFLSIVPSFVIVGVGIVMSAVFIFLLTLGGAVFKIIAGLLLAVWVVFFLLALIMLSLTLIWSYREVILRQKPAMEAFKRGYYLAKKKLWSMLLLGLVNTILSAVVTGIPIVVAFGVVVGGFLSLSAFKDLAVVLIILGTILFFVVIIGLTLLGGILNAFKTSVWTIAYNKIAKKYG